MSADTDPTLNWDEFEALWNVRATFSAQVFEQVCSVLANEWGFTTASLIKAVERQGGV